MMHSGFGQYNNWFCGPGAFFPGPLGWFITLLFWGFIIYLLVKLFQSLFGGKSSQANKSLDTLKERYARGEIAEDEYLRMKAELH